MWDNVSPREGASLRANAIIAKTNRSKIASLLQKKAFYELPLKYIYIYMSLELTCEALPCREAFLHIAPSQRNDSLARRSPLVKHFHTSTSFSNVSLRRCAAAHQRNPRKDWWYKKWVSFAKAPFFCKRHPFLCKDWWSTIRVKTDDTKNGSLLHQKGAY